MKIQHLIPILFLAAFCTGCAQTNIAPKKTGPTSSGGAIDNYRTILNTNTGQYAVVDSQREVVTSYDESGHVIWTTNVIMALQHVLDARLMSGLRISGFEGLVSSQWASSGIIHRETWEVSVECGKDSHVSAMLNVESGALTGYISPNPALDPAAAQKESVPITNKAHLGGLN